MMVYVRAPEGRSYRSFRTADEMATFASAHAERVISVRKDTATRTKVIVRRKADGTRVPVRVTGRRESATERYIVTLRGQIREREPKSRLTRVIMTNGIRLALNNE